MTTQPSTTTQPSSGFTLSNVFLLAAGGFIVWKIMQKKTSSSSPKKRVSFKKYELNAANKAFFTQRYNEEKDPKYKRQLGKVLSGEMHYNNLRD